MFLKKYVKNRRKLKILLLVTVIALIVATIVLFNSNNDHDKIIDVGFIDVFDTKSELHEEHPVIVPEKYNEHKVKTRLIKDKIKYLTQNRERDSDTDNEEFTKLDTVTTNVHIFYTAPVAWYKKGKPHKLVKETIDENDTVVIPQKTPKVLNTAFYPALGLYKPTTGVLRKQFENIKNAGIGVLILTLNPKLSEDLIQLILNTAPSFNLTVTFEIGLANNQSLEFLRSQLETIRKYSTCEAFYRVLSITKNSYVPLIYVSNAYKLKEVEKVFCSSHMENARDVLDALFIGHIRLKNHAETMRRLCFDGFYSKVPSNGATFASTWKNWSYLKSFAVTYKMLFIPTVGPGFAERNKFPRHGDIQRHRSNGRYYGVAWRTAIINHIGFINIASYNNWQDGSQIEEVLPRSGFLDYNPGTPRKYLELTAHWVGNFLKSKKQSQSNCYELLNNTIC
ncbi:glycoprotein endo-alpha-1,2-mannosidase [Episyrphus balteatus]|uniref:glycoprotein endo-alpha-1,2-mannosidase n=1 Tax=Episyrphus balteatus TaxID=286459 RepID=UPI0024868860|nr:glycoprotein endo-alpha-1,2-mannosidase [Episyrphus balteatus]